MNYEWFKNELISLVRRVQVLLTQYTHITQHLQQLQQDNNALQQTVHEQEKKLTYLQDKLKYTTLTQKLPPKENLQKVSTSLFAENTPTPPPINTISAQHDTPHAYISLLDTYIAQLDKCITYLEK